LFFVPFLGGFQISRVPPPPPPPPTPKTFRVSFFVMGGGWDLFFPFLTSPPPPPPPVVAWGGGFSFVFGEQFSIVPTQWPGPFSPHWSLVTPHRGPGSPPNLPRRVNNPFWVWFPLCPGQNTVFPPTPGPGRVSRVLHFLQFPIGLLFWCVSGFFLIFCASLPVAPRGSPHKEKPPPPPRSPVRGGCPTPKTPVKPLPGFFMMDFFSRPSP